VQRGRERESARTDEAHARGRGDDVLGRDGAAARRGRGADGTAAARQLQQVVHEVGADVHQPVSSVVTLVAGDEMAELADATAVQLGGQRPQGAAAAALVVDGGEDAVLAGDGEQLVRLAQPASQRRHRWQGWGGGGGGRGVALFTHGLLDLDLHARVRQNALAAHSHPPPGSVAQRREVRRWGTHQRE